MASITRSSPLFSISDLESLFTINIGREIFFHCPTTANLVDPFSSAAAFCRGAALLERRDRTMLGGNDISDKALQKTVNRRLERSGAGVRSGLSATVQRGIVTLSGKLRYESQRLPIVKALNGVSGVRQVIDRLQSPPKVNPHSRQHGSA